MDDKTPPEGHSLFPEPEVEIIGGATLDEKLDKIIELLESNNREHQEIKDRLGKIEVDLDILQAAYQQHGKSLGELMARVDELWKRV